MKMGVGVTVGIGLHTGVDALGNRLWNKPATTTGIGEISKADIDDGIKIKVDGGETSYGKSSEKLNWDAIVSKKGETRVDHINRHAVPNNTRETHGVFNGNPMDMVDEAWEQRYLVEPISDGMGGTIYNIPYKNAGYYHK